MCPLPFPNYPLLHPPASVPLLTPPGGPKGVPISAILSEAADHGRSIYEAFDWKHGVLVGAAMRSEATAAAEQGKVIMHDPFRHATLLRLQLWPLHCTGYKYGGPHQPPDAQDLSC